MKKSLASLRFLAMFLGIIVVFGLGGSLILAAFDKQETQSQAPLFNFGTIFHGVIHFIQTLFFVAFAGTNHYNTPFWTFFLTGIALTIEFCFISMPLALGSGFIIALMSQSKMRIIRLPARAFVEFIRNTPLLVQLLIIYFGLNFLPQWLNNPFTAGIATLTINYAAYECENLRAGLGAVERGQNEAAVTLGLSRWETLRLILVPQMIPISLPTVINDFIYMFKDSSILSLITVLELTAQSNGLGRLFGEYSWQFFTIGALLYLALSVPLGRASRVLEARLRGQVLGQNRDMTAFSVRALAVSILFGWLAGWLAGAPTIGLSLGGLFALFGQMFIGLMFTLLLLIFVMLLLGIPVYGVSALIRPLRRGRQGAPPIAPQTESTPVGITGIKM